MTNAAGATAPSSTTPQGTSQNTSPGAQRSPVAGATAPKVSRGTTESRGAQGEDNERRSVAGAGEGASARDSSERRGPDADEGETKQPKPRAAAKPGEQEADGEDEAAEVFGEKLTKKELAELRKIREDRKKFDAAAHKKMQDAAELRKQIEADRSQFGQILEALEQDPWALHRARLVKGGMTESQADERINQLAEARLVEQMKRAQMSPEQLELERLRTENEGLKKTQEQRDAEAREQRKTELKAKYREHYDQQVADALVSANLPRTRRMAGKVAAVMAEYKRAQEDIDPGLAAEIVRDEFRTETSHELLEMAKADPKAALATIPKELIELAIEERTKAARDFVPQEKPRKPAPPTPPPKPNHIPDFDEVRKNLGIRTF